MAPIILTPAAQAVLETGLKWLSLCERYALVANVADVGGDQASWLEELGEDVGLAESVLRDTIRRYREELG